MGELRMHVAVIFEDRELKFPLWFLKKGFRHCFLILADQQKTLIIDPTLGRTYVEHLSGYRFFDVVDTLDLQQCTLIWNINLTFKNSKSSLFRFFSCVEVIKSLLGITAPSIVTPFHLFNYLRRDNNWRILSGQ